MRPGGMDAAREQARQLAGVRPDPITPEVVAALRNPPSDPLRGCVASLVVLVAVAARELGAQVLEGDVVDKLVVNRAKRDVFIPQSDKLVHHRTGAAPARAPNQMAPPVFATQLAYYLDSLILRRGSARRQQVLTGLLDGMLVSGNDTGSGVVTNSKTHADFYKATMDEARIEKALAWVASPGAEGNLQAQNSRGATPLHYPCSPTVEVKGPLLVSLSVLALTEREDADDEAWMEAYRAALGNTGGEGGGEGERGGSSSSSLSPAPCLPSTPSPSTPSPAAALLVLKREAEATSGLDITREELEQGRVAIRGAADSTRAILEEALRVTSGSAAGDGGAADETADLAATMRGGASDGIPALLRQGGDLSDSEFEITGFHDTINGHTSVVGRAKRADTVFAPLRKLILSGPL